MGLALLYWHEPYNWGSGNSVHQSFTWFVSLNWRKSTFYRSRVPILFRNFRFVPSQWETALWPIVTSSTHWPAASYCDVTMAHCPHGYLWTHDVGVGASWRDCDNQRSPELLGTYIWLHRFAYRGKMIPCSLRHTARPNNLYTFWVNVFVYFAYRFRTPVFQHGALISGPINWLVSDVIVKGQRTRIFGPPCFNTGHR